MVKICDHYTLHKTFDEEWLLKEKIAALLKTRMYDLLKTEALKLSGHQFPNLDARMLK